MLGRENLQQKNRGIMVTACKILVAAGLLLSVVLFFGFIIYSQFEHCSEGNAYRAASKEVTKRLKSPATAIFPNIEDAKITKLQSEECAFGVVSYVDSQNGFGALIRGEWVADVSLKNGKWSLDGDVIFLK